MRNRGTDERIEGKLLKSSSVWLTLCIICQQMQYRCDNKDLLCKITICVVTDTPNTDTQYSNRCTYSKAKQRKYRGHFNIY